MKTQVQKVVCYIVHDDHLLVFTHDDVPLQVTGVQVPAGSIEAGEEPEQAAVREVFEETGLTASVVRFLGAASYDITPARFEIATRHFFQLSVEWADVTARWQSGESDPSEGDDVHRWTCWWLPLTNAHVLAAGQGALIGRLFDSPDRP